MRISSRHILKSVLSLTLTSHSFHTLFPKSHLIEINCDPIDFINSASIGEGGLLGSNRMDSSELLREGYSTDNRGIKSGFTSGTLLCRIPHSISSSFWDTIRICYYCVHCITKIRAMAVHMVEVYRGTSVKMGSEVELQSFFWQGRTSELLSLNCKFIAAVASSEEQSGIQTFHFVCCTAERLPALGNPRR